MVQLSRCVVRVWYLGRQVDRLQSISSTPACVFSLAGVSGLSAEFGTLGGMLIGYSHQVQHCLGRGVGELAKFDTLGAMLVGNSP